MKDKFCPVCLAAATLVSPETVDDDKTGISMPGSLVLQDQRLLLTGMAVREKLLFHTYVAGLYLAETTTDSTAILQKDAPRVMVMHFLRTVTGDKMVAEWLRELEKNVDDIPQDIHSAFARLAQLMPTIERNQTLQLNYLPLVGTEVAVAGKIKGTIEGKDFSDAMLATWIGPRPGPGQKFKKALLGH